ncbi:hypothetical protein ACFQY4_17635 [Catellatospora bangladeshensis]|uniref:Uncharacterized protein n=1 Tax=Catellatospora bangladeshensis TaxID=310355 RepID=A0A8J3JC57_9ACTN|nr:hypothetical protein [Catellatospora bangladeshensis]GIF82157.1 hypothetical protein Cba03nite_35060 [Catellatospora bangladeshensis]
MSHSGDAGTGRPAPYGEDVAQIVHLFACLAYENTAPPEAESEAGPEYRAGLTHGRLVEQELVARIAAMAAGRSREPVHIPYDGARAADSEFRRGTAAGRRLVHEALLVSHRMIMGESCPSCGQSGPGGHAAHCRHS